MKLSFISWVNNPEQYDKFKKSVQYFNHELITIGQECKSLAQAYNKGTRQANWDIFVYVHQDIRIIDLDFQKKLEDIFKYWNNIWFAWPVWNISISNKAWWNTDNVQQWAGQILQWESKFERFTNQNCAAWNLDGCLLCTDKRFLFPEELPWIHFVDAWMCRMAIEKWFQNYCFETFVQHMSQWKIDEQFHKNMEIYQKHFNLI